MLDSVLKLNSTKLKNFSLIWSFEIALRSEFNRLIVNPTKWSNTLKQFVGNLPTNCLIVFDHFVIFTLKEFKIITFVNVPFNTISPHDCIKEPDDLRCFWA